jgi:hypothetical protein
MKPLRFVTTQFFRWAGDVLRDIRDEKSDHKIFRMRMLQHEAVTNRVMIRQGIWR